MMETCRAIDWVMIISFGALALACLGAMAAMCMTFWYDKKADAMRNNK